MRVALLGSAGQLGLCVADTLPPGIELITITRDQLDITDESRVVNYLSDISPDWVVNAAAYTAVDQAETDAQAAREVNGKAAGYIANACKLLDARMLHVSTDFVFDGQRNTPYGVESQVHPLGRYGESKLLGETLVNENLPTTGLIIRTSWLYSEYGNNFVKTMLRVMAEHDQVSVVNDQFGIPTYARGLAMVIWQLIVRNQMVSGIFHWSDRGVISWYQFALEIQRQAFEKGLLSTRNDISAITTSEYPTAARRPVYSALDCSELDNLLEVEGDRWQDALSLMLDRFKASSL